MTSPGSSPHSADAITSSTSPDAHAPLGADASPAPSSRWLSAWKGYRWGARALRAVRRDVRDDGVGVAVPVPPLTARGSLRGARIALRVRRASCLERSLVVQRWWASRGVPLDVIVGVRHPDRSDGPLAHAWVDRWDEDWSDRYAEIRRVSAPE